MENTVATAKTVKAKKKHSIQYDNWGYAFIAPFFIIYIIFLFYHVKQIRNAYSYHTDSNSYYIIFTHIFAF